MNQGAEAVLVPGAAGAAGIDALRSLRVSHPSLRLIATDGEPLAGGFAFSDAWYLSHSIKNEEAFQRIRQMMIKEGVKIILPTALTDTAVYASRKGDLSSSGIFFAGSERETIELCDDKERFYGAVCGRYPLPALISCKEGGPTDYPCFVKPRHGSGSIGAGICRNIDDFRFYGSMSNDLLVQEYLPGTEYSVDVLCDFEGCPIIAVPRERISILGGVTVRARIRRDEELENLGRSIAAFLRIKGACCVQMRRDQCGSVKILEVNARVAGSAVMSRLAGVDIAGLLLDLALGRNVTAPVIKEITVVRVWDALVMDSP